LANQAFADFYGTSRTVQVGDANSEFASPAVMRMAFDNPHWTMDWSVGGSGLGNSSTSFTHKELASINLNDPPDLHHVEAVGFDFDAGWSTAQANVARDADGLETVAEVAFIVGVGIVTLGAMAGFGFGGNSLGAVVATAAAVGGTTSIASGFIHDNLSLNPLGQVQVAHQITALTAQAASGQWATGWPHQGSPQHGAQSAEGRAGRCAACAGLCGGPQHALAAEGHGDQVGQARAGVFVGSAQFGRKGSGGCKKRVRVD
jgi:hypothetical protein